MSGKNPRSGSPTPSVSGRASGMTTPGSQEMTVTSKEVKVPMPEYFDGTRGKLKTFLIQVELYMSFQPTKFRLDTKKVLWTVTLLKGPAFDWIQVYVDDYMQNQNNAKKETMEIIDNWAEFRSQLESMFGDIDEEHTAERSLQQLRQKGPASRYAADFRRFAAKTEWNKGALRAQFYKGLKDSIKDEMARTERPDELDKMIDLAITIDDRLYERQLEKRGGGTANFGGYRTGGTKPQKSQPYYGPMPMELDAAQRQHQRPKPSKQEMDRRRTNKLCFTCGLPGHMSAAHKKGGSNNRQGNNKGKGQRRQISATSSRGLYDKIGGMSKRQIAVLTDLNAFDPGDDWDVVAPSPTPSEPSEGSDRTTYFDTTEVEEAFAHLCARQAQEAVDEAEKEQAIADFLKWQEKIDKETPARERRIADKLMKGNEKHWPKLERSASMLQAPQEFLTAVEKNPTMQELALEGEPSWVEKYIEDAESCDEDPQFILSETEEKELFELCDKAYNEYMTWKSARLDATKVDHPEHGTLHFSACADDDCLIHLSDKEATYFPRRVKPVFKARSVTHRICALSEIKEDESDEEMSEDAEDWKNNVQKETQKKTRRQITIELPDSEDEAEDELERFSQAEEALWKLIQRKRAELQCNLESHGRIQKAIAKMCGDVGHPSHPRHPEIQYRFCAYDGCQTHIDSKIKDAYFHVKKEPIYWVQVIRDPDTENVERIQGPDWKTIRETQQRLWALNN
jgi:Domain of unknown function (DUF4939)